MEDPNLGRVYLVVDDVYLLYPVLVPLVWNR